MIRKILVPISGDGTGEVTLAHAAVLARRYGAHIETAHCRPLPETLAPYGIPVPGFMREQIAQQASGVADLEEGRLRAEFDALAERHGLRLLEAPDGEGPSASWIELRGKRVDAIKTRGRLSDLIVVPKPDRDRNLGANALKAALFNTARPVLMCAPTPPVESLGARVAVGWNGSLEATRAVALSLDVLLSAEAVTILTADREEVHGATAADLQSYLAIRGIAASLHRFAARRRAGEALLEESARLGADLLIMGAYGVSHERETLFGGNTQAVVDRSEMPVLLVH